MGDLTWREVYFHIWRGLGWERERERGNAVRVRVDESVEVCGTWLSGSERVGFQMCARSRRPFTLSRTILLSKWSRICGRLLSSFHSAFPLGMKQIMAKMSFWARGAIAVGYIMLVSVCVCVCVPTPGVIEIVTTVCHLHTLQKKPFHFTFIHISISIYI